MSAKPHHWSGWPGAFCLDCGCEDPMEIAVADCLYDPYKDKWEDTPEAVELRTRAGKSCPAAFNPKCGQCVAGKKR